MATAASPARARARLLARRGPAALAGQRPLLCPLALVQAAEVDAVAVAELQRDPTRLAGGLRRLREALGAEMVVTAVPDGLVAGAAAGASSARLEAAVEATARLEGSEANAVVVAAFEGPARLAAQLGAGAGATGLGERLEAAGELLRTVAARFLEAGAHLVVLVEDQPLAPGNHDAWRAAVTPLANVARFRQAPLAIALAGGDADARALPAGAVACLPIGAAGGSGVALPADPAAWPAACPPGTVVTTLGAVTADFASTRAALVRLAGVEAVR